MSVSFLNEMRWWISGFQASNWPVARLPGCYHLIHVEDYHGETTGGRSFRSCSDAGQVSIGKLHESLLPVFFFLLSYNGLGFRKLISLETCSETDFFSYQSSQCVFCENWLLYV